MSEETLPILDVPSKVIDAALAVGSTGWDPASMGSYARAREVALAVVNAWEASRSQAPRVWHPWDAPEEQCRSEIFYMKEKGCQFSQRCELVGPHSGYRHVAQGYGWTDEQAYKPSDA